MNIFNDTETFLGELPLGRLADAYLEFFTLAAEIRSRLGGKAYLLDDYLAQLFSAAGDAYTSGGPEDGLGDAISLYAICRASRHPDREVPHPFFAEGKAFIQSHPLAFQEVETRNCAHIAMMANGYMESSIHAYRQQFLHDLDLRFDTAELGRAFQDISRLLESELPLERLNLLFRERFLTVPALAVFYKALNNELLGALSRRDKETSLQVFQLVMDHRLLENAVSD